MPQADVIGFAYFPKSATGRFHRPNFWDLILPRADDISPLHLTKMFQVPIRSALHIINFVIYGFFVTLTHKNEARKFHYSLLMFYNISYFYSLWYNTNLKRTFMKAVVMITDSPLLICWVYYVKYCFILVLNYVLKLSMS